MISKQSRENEGLDTREFKIFIQMTEKPEMKDSMHIQDISFISLRDNLSILL